MRLFKAIWGLLFRLFPCPTPAGLRRLGTPGPKSPVLVTCNFYTTVRRLVRTLRGVDAWLLVADSKGVNVWCAAGGDELNTHSVVSVVKTSGIARMVDHRTLILPPLSAPGVSARTVSKETGWKVRWGPVHMDDIPRYLAKGFRRNELAKRATYGWKERLDTALGSLFPFYLLGAVGFWIFGANLLLSYLAVGALCFVLFFSLCPWLPGSRGLTKVMWLNVVLGMALAVTWVSPVPWAVSIRADLVIAMVVLLIYGGELGGLASTMPSDLDPLMARLGVGAVGNVAWAGTVRTELLNGFRILSIDRDLCVGCRCCAEVCPRGVWEMGEDRKAVMARREDCTACRACLVQCGTGAITAEPVSSDTAARWSSSTRS